MLKTPTASEKELITKEQEKQLLFNLLIFEVAIHDFLMSLEVILYKQKKLPQGVRNSIKEFYDIHIAKSKIAKRYDLSENFKNAFIESIYHLVSKKNFPSIERYKHYIATLEKKLNNLYGLVKVDILRIQEIGSFLNAYEKAQLEVTLKDLTDKAFKNYVVAQKKTFYPRTVSILVPTALYLGDLLFLYQAFLLWLALHIILIFAPNAYQTWNFRKILYKVENRSLYFSHIARDEDLLDKAAKFAWKSIEWNDKREHFELGVAKISPAPSVITTSSLFQPAKEIKQTPIIEAIPKQSSQNQNKTGKKQAKVSNVSGENSNKVNNSIDFTDVVGYIAKYDSADLKNSTIFPFKVPFENPFYLSIHPDIQNELSAESFEKFYTVLKGGNPVGKHGQGIKCLNRFIEDPTTGKKYICYELKPSGFEGEKRLVGAIRVIKEHKGKPCYLIEFNTLCDSHVPAKLTRSLERMQNRMFGFGYN